MKSLNYENNEFAIEGAVSVEINENYIAPWRLDFARKKLFPFLDAFGQADACTCVRIAFTTDSENICIDIYETYKGEDGIHDIMMLDLVVDGEFIQTIKLNKGEGTPGQWDNPEIDEARKKIAKTAANFGKFAGTVGGAQNFDRLIDMGYNFVSMGADVVGLSKYCREIISAVSHKTESLKNGLYDK
jgi:2-keto-3-deoxy-L-rhamnonate aldolase RhmA